MYFLYLVIALSLLVLGLAAAVFRIRDAARRRNRLAHADIVDGMPDEIQNLPSHADGSTGPD
jgi:hypothetical protein